MSHIHIHNLLVTCPFICSLVIIKTFKLIILLWGTSASPGVFVGVRRQLEDVEVLDLGIKLRLPGLVGKCLCLLSYLTISQNCSLNLLILGFISGFFLTIILL